MSIAQFNKTYEKISLEFNKHKILAIEVLFPLLENEIFKNNTIIILSTRNSKNKYFEFIPSLSTFKEKNNKTNIFDNTEQIKSYFKINIHKNLTEKTLEEIANQNKLMILNYKINDCIILVSDFNILKNVSYFDKLANLMFYIKRQSLNILNDSFKKRDEIRDKVEDKLYVPQIQTFIRNLCNSSIIKEKFPNVSFFALEYIEKNNSWICLDNCPLYITEICKNNVHKIKSEKNISISTIINNEQHIIYPFLSPLSESRNLQYIIVIHSKFSIDSYVVDNLRYITNHYYAIYLKQEKYNILYSLTNQTLELPNLILNSIDNAKAFNIKELLQRTLNQLFIRILEVTNIHSISLRIIDYKNNELIKVVSAEDDKNIDHILKDVNSKTKETDFPIQINNKDSQIASTFRQQHYIYTQDVKNSKNSYKEHRKNTRSELSYPLKYKDITIGVLNFESPLIDGLFEYYNNSKDKSKDKLFDKFKLGIENFIRIAYDYNDIHWIARRSQMYQNNHEIRRVIDNNEIPNSLREQIYFYISNLPIDEAKEKVSLGELNDYRKKLIEDYFITEKVILKNNKYYNSIKELYYSRLKIQLSNTSVRLSKYKLDMIKIIYKNLLDNFKDHSNHKKDSISLVYKKKRPSTLYMIANLYNIESFKHKDIKNLLYTPYNEITYIENKKITKTHYGLFMIGMLTRYLNGFVSIDYIKQKDPNIKILEYIELKIQIPMKEENEY